MKSQRVIMPGGAIYSIRRDESGAPIRVERLTVRHSPKDRSPTTHWRSVWCAAKGAPTSTARRVIDWADQRAKEARNA